MTHINLQLKMIIQIAPKKMKKDKTFPLTQIMM